MMPFAKMMFAIALIAAPAGAIGQIYVMRHLQKEPGADPALTARGVAGAQELAAMLGAKGIKAVFATQTRRAQQTAAPLAKGLGITITTYDPADMQTLKQSVAGVAGPVLVVGHSNTVPDLVALFGGDRPADIADDEYETIYIVEPDKPVVQVKLSQF